MTTIVNGLLGGAIVGVVATLAAHLTSGKRGAKATGTESTASRWSAYLSSVAYGSAAGGVLVALDLFVLGVLAVPPSLGEALTVAVAWSLALLVAALAVRRSVRGTRFERPKSGELLVYHLVLGFGLGLWVRTTWIT